MDLPGHMKTLAPGMTQVIEAGEHYTLTDDNGAELELVGKLDEVTIKFLKAFDVWLALHLRIGDVADPTKAAWAGVTSAWNDLPKHVREAIR